MTQLLITNGDSAGELLQQSNVPGEVLPWRDVLHEGPVPGGLTVEALAERRAAYLAESGMVTLETVRASFAEREAVLQRLGDFERVVLWFEHDLYDQLQILEVLTRLSTHNGCPPVWMVCIGSHPEVPDFHGLGQLNTTQIEQVAEQAQPLEAQALEHATRGWAALTAETPLALMTFANENHGPFEFLGAALGRLLQEYPWTTDGLSRSERQILQLATQTDDPKVIFQRQPTLEPAPFMGDWSFARIVMGLMGEPGALRVVEGPVPHRPSELFASRVELTPIGRELIAEREDWVTLRGVDRWIGGVHLSDDQWRWDPHQQSVVERERSGRPK